MDGMTVFPVTDARVRRHRIRRAVGIFRDAALLRNALRTLQDGGFGADRIAILAGRAVLARLGWSLVDPPGDPEERTVDEAGFRDFTEISISEQSGPLLVSNGEFARLLADWAGSEGHSFHCLLDSWLDRSHAQFLQQQIDSGAITLWVRVSDGEEEVRACRILLRTSAERVQVHDIAAGSS